jgi:hypothetical protein
MKILRVEKARAIWLGQVDDINPRGRYIRQEAIAEMVARYKFSIFPDTKKPIGPSSGEVFQEGIFQKQNGDKIGVDLTIFGDGLVADTRASTEDSDSFLDDVSTWASKSLNLSDYREIVTKKNYLSVIYVETEQSLIALNPKLAKLLASISPQIGNLVEPIGIAIGVDEGLERKPIPFRFERAEGVSFSENRYYSSAPLQTQDHIELLEEFEKILST